MPSISFQNVQPINTQQNRQSNKKQEIEPLLLFNINPLNRQEKQCLLRELLTTNLNNKSREDVIKFCKNGLDAISEIVGSNGNLEQARNTLNQRFPNEKDFISKLLTLFTNRTSNSVFNFGLGYQNINKNAAKYSEILRQILSTLNPEEKLNEARQGNINLISNEASKWYRANYIKNISVKNTNNGLAIKLGQENGDMGQNYKLNITFLVKESFNQNQSMELSDNEGYSSNSSQVLGKQEDKILPFNQNSIDMTEYAQFKKIIDDTKTQVNLDKPMFQIKNRFSDYQPQTKTCQATIFRSGNHNFGAFGVINNDSLVKLYLNSNGNGYIGQNGEQWNALLNKELISQAQLLPKEDYYCQLNTLDSENIILQTTPEEMANDLGCNIKEINPLMQTGNMTCGIHAWRYSIYMYYKYNNLLNKLDDEQKTSLTNDISFIKYMYNIKGIKDLKNFFNSKDNVNVQHNFRDLRKDEDKFEYPTWQVFLVKIQEEAYSDSISKYELFLNTLVGKNTALPTKVELIQKFQTANTQIQDLGEFGTPINYKTLSDRISDRINNNPNSNNKIGLQILNEAVKSLYPLQKLG